LAAHRRTSAANPWRDRASISFFSGMRLVLALVAILIAPVVLRPGASDIDSTHFRNEARTWRMLIGDSEVGRFHYEWRMLPPDNVQLVMSGAYRSQPYVDTSIVKQHGLAPVREISRHGSDIDQFTYDGPRVTRIHATPDSGTRRFEHTYDGPVFTFAELEDLIRSLPLRAGYERILPLYSEGTDTLEMDTVRVVTRAADGQWTLRFADPDIVATFGIDERTRRTVRFEYTVRRDGRLRRYLN
jgi:hypothetical protein